MKSNIVTKPKFDIYLHFVEKNPIFRLLMNFEHIINLCAYFVAANQHMTLLSLLYPIVALILLISHYLLFFFPIAIIFNV